MYTPHHSFNHLASTQNITPIPTSLHNGTMSAEDITTIYNTNIPEELPTIDEEMANGIEIDEEFTQSLSNSLANLIRSVPSFPLPQFIPHKPLHSDVNIQAEIDKLLGSSNPPPPPPPPPPQAPQPPQPPQPPLHIPPHVPPYTAAVHINTDPHTDTTHINTNNTTTFTTNPATTTTTTTTSPPSYYVPRFSPHQTSTPPSSPIPYPHPAPPPPPLLQPYDTYFHPNPQYLYSYCAYPHTKIDSS